MSQGVQIGSILEGKIIKIKPFGAIVAISENEQGLVHISQISDSFVQDINDVVAVGDIVKVKVLTKDEESGKITLSMKAAMPESGRQSRNQSGEDGRQRPASYEDMNNRPKQSEMSFDEKLKDWIKQSNERQAGINKRNNRR